MKFSRRAKFLEVILLTTICAIFAMTDPMNTSSMFYSSSMSYPTKTTTKSGTGDDYDKLSSLLIPLLNQDNLNSQSPILAALGVQDGRIPLDITASSSDPHALLEDLKPLGFEVTATFKHIVSGLLPISKLAALAKLSTVNFVHPVISSTNSGDST